MTSGEGGRPIHEGLFTWPSESPQLVASRCQECEEVTFPRQDSCPSCTGRSCEEVLLSRRGKLWTWTIQRFPPPVPPYIGPPHRDTFVPYGVGYVELPEGIRVEGRLTVNDPARLEIGMDMELVVEKFIDDEDGTALLTFAFQPVAEA
ncbi:MAG: OB-fold domain-containing protein [Myxococcota bacterium]|nr:OB-fold domain-containing protein [Myxococcota bacterium]